MKLSVVTTLYHSSKYIEDFYERITEGVKKITGDYEIIFVDDGSPDDSLQKAITIYKTDKKVKILELSRNFGHHKAIMTGLANSKGDYVFLIDSDLEEEPELLKRFWKKMINNRDIDMVYGVQKKRKGGVFEKISGWCFYHLFNILSEVKTPKNFLTVRLMNRNYVNNLIRFREREMNFSSIVGFNGFKSLELKVKKFSHSPTSYSIRQKLSVFINAVTSSSVMPLWICFYLGLFITFISLVFISKLIFQKLYYGINVEGWTSVMLSIWFFGGLIIMFLGLIGVYISKNFIEAKNRPYTIIRTIYDGERSD